MFCMAFNDIWLGSGSPNCKLVGLTLGHTKLGNLMTRMIRMVDKPSILAPQEMHSGCTVTYCYSFCNYNIYVIQGFFSFARLWLC